MAAVPLVIGRYFADSWARKTTMARIVLSSVGTTGDHVPFVALGKALQDRGHAVIAAVNEAMAPLFRNAGLESVICGRRFGPEGARQAAIALDVWQPASRTRAE